MGGRFLNVGFFYEWYVTTDRGETISWFDDEASAKAESDRLNKDGSGRAPTKVVKKGPFYRDKL